MITWATPASITYGTALGSTQLDATASVPGTFVYSPAAGNVLTAGTQTSFGDLHAQDTTDYTTATDTVQLIVKQATPTITWATPASITYGTALCSTQLDATANVAGTFAYSPAAGTVLKAGTQTLSVTFTPTRYHRLHHGDRPACSSSSTRPRRRSPGLRQRTSRMARP